MPKYKTTTVCFLPAPFNAGVEVTYRGWPVDHLGLDPLDDEAKKIAAYYHENKMSGVLPLTPFEGGKLHLPPVGPPLWKLGQRFKDLEAAADPEDRTLMTAIGHRAMKGQRSTRARFSANMWPEPDIEPVNDQAKAIAEYMAAHPDGPFEGQPWDELRGCLNVSAKQAA